MQESKTVELDVRPYLRKKLEPFQLIMDTVNSLDTNDIFVLHATFKPTPLLMLLKGKGYRNTVEKIDKDHWITTFTHKNRQVDETVIEPLEENDDELEVEAPRIFPDTPVAEDTDSCQGKIYELDNRGLEPPAPMMRTLKQLEKAKPGDTVAIHNDRVPVFLIEELQSLGYAYEIEEQEDGTAKVNIHKS